ncbi:UNVERIFIED_CONTAM: hypothetical protein GTU68_012551 [Idotea baltica]|nr:hypothetical protein [Idotea baltica]
MTIEKAKEALKHYFGYDDFRPMQEDIVSEVIGGRDAVVLMPTGGGKSICFQIPALVMEGVAVVVSPLIALMQDQVEGLVANGVKAAFMNSSSSSAENMEVLHQAMDGKLDLLYVSPEKLLSMDFAPMLGQLKIALFAVDEAHCISSWGHDFRPEYTQLSFLKDKFPHTPVIALTATADKATRKDIETQLGLRNPARFLASFDRPNLSLRVEPGRNRVKTIQDWVQARPGQSGIVYCLSRKSTEKVAEKLKAQGVNAAFYHAGMGPSFRAKVQQDFIRDDIQVICATIAFGMGIDKSNIRWVIHYNLPKNLEGYYQEIGRAGRDGVESETMLFYSYGDVIQLKGFIEDSGQPEIGMQKLERMQQYANAKICRRKVLLGYFSEYLAENCNNCDVCHNPPETIEGTILAQKALSALVRLKEMVGMNILIDVLRGSGRRDIIQAGYDKIKTYGAGADLSRPDWQEYLFQMLDQGLFEIAYDQGSSLKLTEQGRNVLMKGFPVELVRRVVEKAAPSTRKKSAVKGNIPTNEKLFQRLKKLRKKLADKQGIPPYIVFHDATLKQMAASFPATEVQLRSISGVGDRKLKLYGDKFVNEILQFLQETGETPKADPVGGATAAKQRQKPSGAKKEKKPPTHLLSYELHKEGKSVEQISWIRNLKPSTIISHLLKLYQDGEKEVDVFKFVKVEDLKTILEAARDQGGSGSIRELYEALEERFEYHQIRFALAYLKKQQTIS